MAKQKTKYIRFKNRNGSRKSKVKEGQPTSAGYELQNERIWIREHSQWSKYWDKFSGRHSLTLNGTFCFKKGVPHKHD